MQKLNGIRIAILFAFAILLGLTYNTTFLWQSQGLGLLLFTSLAFTFAQTIRFWRVGKFTWTKLDYLWLVVAGVATAPFVTGNATVAGMSVFYVLLVGEYLSEATILGQRILNVRVRDIVISPTVQILKGLNNFPKAVNDEALAKRSFRKKILPLVSKVFVGLILGTPILFCFAILLTMSDSAFANVVGRRFSEQFENVFSRGWEILLLGISLMFWVGIGYRWLKAKNLSANERKFYNRKLDATSATVIIGLINLLFLSFVAVQLVYLFGDRNKIIELGLTYSQYAVRGFYELVLVALMVIGIVLFVRRLAFYRNPTYDAVQQVSIVVMLCLTGVMLASAFHRMNIYTSGYGLSEQRFLVQIGILGIGSLLIYLVYATLFKFGLQLFSPSVVGLIGIFITVVGVINPDAHVARFNIARSEAYGINAINPAKRLDVDYLLTLSSDSYVQILNSANYRENETISCRIVRLWDEEGKKRNTITSIHTNRIMNATAVEAARTKFSCTADPG